MLGTSRWSKQTTIEDFKSPQDFMEYMFQGIRGWICRGQMQPYYRQTMYRFNGMMQSDLLGENVYVSMNTFFKNERLVDSLKRLNALYVDIDCYKVGMDKSGVLMALQDDVFERIIPCPTFVIDSGRGLYLIWKLQNEDRNALPRWTSVQEYICKALEPFGADPACKDAARILRVPFSINSKSNTMVEIIQFNDVTYRISDIEKEYGIFGTSHRPHREDGRKTHPYGTATEAMRRYAYTLALKLGVTLPDFDSFKETQEWLKKMRLYVHEKHQHEDSSNTHVNPQKNQKLSRILGGYCEDIEKLMTMRQGADCKREIALFLYRLFLYDLSGDKTIALERTLVLNANLSCPLPERYVIKATMSAERKIDKGETYHYKRETIIQILEITNEEMADLSYLVGAEQRKARKKTNNRKTYLDRLAAAGKETKKESVMKRRDTIVAMQKDGKSAEEIQSALQISKATYYRECAVIKCGNVVDAARDAVGWVTEKVAQTAEEAARNVLEGLEEAQEAITEPMVAKDKKIKVLKVVRAAVIRAVSKIKPFNYKSMAKPCRTAFGLHGDRLIFDSSGGSGG